MKTNSNLFLRRNNLLGGTIAAILGTAVIAPQVMAQSSNNSRDNDELEEVVITGSRIVRRDMQTNSPLFTVELQQLENSAFISVEQALNELPQFMAGGVGMGSNAVTSLQGANGLAGGAGSGDMFNMALLPDNAGVIGIVVPGAANVNLRGLGANRALTLIDGHRAMPVNASMTVDLNTIPTIAIGGMEVITGGASAVYGADALAGVTNIKFRDNYEGMNVRIRGGMNEVGDGDEYQVSTLIGSDVGNGRAHVLVGLEYSRREESLWRERDFFREAMYSPYSNAGDYIFGAYPYYSSGANPGASQGGTYNVLQKAWNGNAPSTAAILSLFSDRNCRDTSGALVNCIADASNAPRGGGWWFNTDGTIFTRNSQLGQGAAALYYGPQGFNGNTVASPGNPDEITCTFINPQTLGASAPNSTMFPGENCNPTLNRVDEGRWLSSPREAYNVFGRATFEITDSLSAFTNFHYATSITNTRREPAPYQGPGFSVVVPFHTSQGGNAVYLPSVILTPAPGQVAGATRSEYLPGGTRGTNCAPIGGCTMAQAFPVPAELRTLLESRPGTALIPTTGANANNPFRGLNACNSYILANNLPDGAPGVLTNPNGGARYTLEMDPNTGKPLSRCGPNSGWQLNQTPPYLDARGTTNTGQLFQIAGGFRGDLGIKDWTWELYGSTGQSETQTNYDEFTSLNTYQRILSAPNYGQGYVENGLSSKFLRCTSGLNPFNPNLVVTQDCLDALGSNQIDRNSMAQHIVEATAQGALFDLPAGEVRGAVGAQWRENDYQFTPDSLRERDYITDSSAGAFAAGSVDEVVDVKEVYGELLIPLLKDLPFIQALELELGARYSEYSTGQEVDTYKVMGSWVPVEWMRVRGGYNRAERAPNMSELFATPSGSAQFAQIPSDPCRNTPTLANTFPGPTVGTTLNNTDTTDPAIRAKLQALCSAQINAWGGNNASEFHGNQELWDLGGGGALIVGNANLRNEQGDTWTLGAAFSSPFEHPLLSGFSGTVDWYKARVTDPVEVVATGIIINSCYNINGLNPNYQLDDPKDFCSLIERDPVSGQIVRVFNTYDNQGRLEISGVDMNLRWGAALSDLGIEKIPGAISISTNYNFLIDQIQRYGADRLGDYAGYGGAAKHRANTMFNYTVDQHRLTLTWNYRDSTDIQTNFATVANAEGSNSPTLTRNLTQVGYKTVNLFNLTAATVIGGANVSLNVSNLFDKKPRAGGYDIRDPRQGFGTFSPFDDLVGRRYSFNVSMDF